MSRPAAIAGELAHGLLTRGALWACAAVLLGTSLGCAARGERAADGPAGNPAEQAAIPAVPGEAEGAAGQADLYVSPSGADSASGRSPDEALRTIARAAELIRPGERVLVLPGSYHEMVELIERGDPARPITISGIPGETILDGERRLPAAFWCEGCRGAIFEGLTIQNYSDAGVVVLYAQQVMIRDLLVSDNGFDPKLHEWEFEGYGIEVESSSGIQIEGNQVLRNGPNPKRPDHMMGSSINTYACRDCVIRGNLCSQNVGGVIIEDAVNMLVEDNLIVDNDLDVGVDRWWDGGIWLDGGRDVTLRGNRIHGNQGPGMQISDEELAQPTGYVLEDNLVTGNLIGLYLWNFGTWELPGEPTLRASGNRFEDNQLVDIYISPTWCFPPEPCDPEG